MLPLPTDAAALAAATASLTAPLLTDLLPHAVSTSAIAFSLPDGCPLLEYAVVGADGALAHGPPFPSPTLDLSTERLEAQDNLLWGGRSVAELSDAELAAAAGGMAAACPPPEQAVIRNQRNWLKLRVQWPQPRVHVHLRVDEIVLDWFRRDGPGFQGRLNAVLRAYVDAQIEAEQRAR